MRSKHKMFTFKFKNTYPMKKFLHLLSILLVLFIVGCESFGQKETHKEISIEKRKSTTP